MPTRGNRSLTARAEDDVHERVERAAKRAGVTKAAWVLEAVLWALEQDEGSETAKPAHVPAAIAKATPRRTANGHLLMPAGRVFDHR